MAETNQKIVARANHYFQGKTLKGKRKRRGEDDPQEQADAFIELFSQFKELLQQLDPTDRSAFISKANGVNESRMLGDALAGGQDDVTNEFSDMNVDEIRAIMQFIIEEGVMEFEDDDDMEE